MLGAGDDCAVFALAPEMHLATSTDMLIAGRHFFPDADPYDLGHKALAVNLSDLAACAARPLAFTLGLALPVADSAWLAEFSRGLYALADASACPLVGGDTTQTDSAAPLCISITVYGEVPAHAVLKRSAARPGDCIYVSGALGAARAALHANHTYQAYQTHAGCGLSPTGAEPWQPPAAALRRLHRPTPRLSLGLALRGLAHSAIDVSDGLLGDLAHILRASHCGAELDAAALLACADAALAALPPALQLEHVLCGGDDYELCFTAAPEDAAAVLAAAASCGTPVHHIGTITAAPGLRMRELGGGFCEAEALVQRYPAYRHFA